MITAVVPTTAPLEALNGFLNGVGSLSATDARRAAGSACEVAQTVCKPIKGPSPYGMYGSSSSIDAERYAAMAKAFAAMTEGAT